VAGGGEGKGSGEQVLESRFRVGLGGDVGNNQYTIQAPSWPACVLDHRWQHMCVWTA
jgi:hypothetical protein